MGVLDFSGGGPVEIGSGVGGLAYAFMLGNRKERDLAKFRCVRVILKQISGFTHLSLVCFLLFGGLASFE